MSSSVGVHFWIFMEMKEEREISKGDERSRSGLGELKRMFQACKTTNVG